MAEAFLTLKDETLTDLFSKYQFSLNFNAGGLQKSLYYFFPDDFERGTQQFIRAHVKPGMIAMDIGAHIGLITILLADRVGPEGSVYAFEPEDNNFLQLEQNIGMNRLEWVHLFHMAITDREGDDVLAVSPSTEMHMIHRLSTAKSTNTDKNNQSIRTTTLDAFMERQRLPKIDLLKIDAESSELMVCQGGKNSFSRNRIPTVICEIHSTESQSVVGQDRVRKLFYDYGYRSYILDTTVSKRAYLSELKSDEPVIGLQNLLFKKQL